MPARSTLVFTGALIAVSAATLAAQAPNDAKAPSINGVVRDLGDNPIADAELSLSRPGQAARLFRTGADGKYTFPAVARGEVLISVRRLGYRGSSMKVDVGAGSAPSSVDFELQEIPSEVADVIVEGSKGHLQEFYQHKGNNNFAKFFERKDIEARNPFYLSEMIRTVGGANISSKGAGNRILLRGCQPMVWVDGMRAPGAELDDLARPGDVAAMEVYPSSAGLPAEYQDRNNRMCGAIFVWTKNQ